MALDTNLVSYWKLDESSGNAADSVGSNTLTNTGTVSYASGKISNGADYGTGNTGGKYLSIDSTLSMATRASDRTYSFWYKAKAISDGEDWKLFNHAYAASKNEIGIDYNRSGSTYTLTWEDSNTGGAGGGSFSTTQQLTADTWYHFVWVRSSGVLYGYMNGSLINSASITDSTGASVTVDRFIIGQLSRVVNDRNADGMFDEVGVWSRALDGTEITSLYNSGTGLTYPFVQNITMTTVVGAFTLTGVAAIIGRTYTMITTVGQFILSGINAIMTLTGTHWTNQSKNSSSWTNQSKNSSTWSNQSKNSSSWSNQTKH